MDDGAPGTAHFPADPDYRAEVETWRKKELEATRAAFAVALGTVQLLQEMSAANPDNTELKTLTETLHVTMKRLLNTVTCKIIANGLAADWELLLISGPPESEEKA